MDDQSCPPPAAALCHPPVVVGVFPTLAAQARTTELGGGGVTGTDITQLFRSNSRLKACNKVPYWRYACRMAEVVMSFPAQNVFLSWHLIT